MHHDTTESHHHSSAAAAAIAKLLNLFRSKSDPTVKSDSTKSHSKQHSKSRSASPSPTGGPVAPRRRFVRVVRDAEAQAPEVIDDNPHVICRYSQSFLEDHYRKSVEELSKRPLPYVISGPTILKKSSTDPTSSYEQHSPTVGKHATFKELVEIIEFSGQDVVKSDGAHVSHEARLHDDEVPCTEDDHQESGFFLRNESVSSEADDITGLDTEAEASSQPEDEVEGSAKVPSVDLDRMDGIMRNIFSSVANVHEASPEPPKIRRVELSELLSHSGTEERPEVKNVDKS